ncbi:MAG: ATP-binding protein, partial [Proteobacteria bacterium]|nr:ATP-binding protein [Pseudomonadota bacterium]MBU1710010.1 ATP-binding protein [Pseudomonadota bacterium]
CPCGYLGDPNHECTCSAMQIQRYESRLSGPLLDRIDLHLEVPAVPFKKISAESSGESSFEIRSRVSSASAIQKERFSKRKNFYNNGQMTPRDLKKYCVLDNACRDLLEEAVNRLRLSARSYHRILKIARTIADLAESETIMSTHIAEAVQYRRLDRKR